MTLLERHKAILELLRESGSVDVGDLSLRLRVSAVTIRKDLDQLEERQLLYRTHGGAVLADPYIATRKVSEKEKLNPELKHRTEGSRAFIAAGGADHCVGNDGSGVCPVYSEHEDDGHYLGDERGDGVAR